MQQKVIRAGNSTAVTVPAKFVKMVGVRIGDIVNVFPHPDTGQISYKFSGVQQLKLLKKPPKV